MYVIYIIICIIYLIIYRIAYSHASNHMYINRSPCFFSFSADKSLLIKKITNLNTSKARQKKDMPIKVSKKNDECLETALSTSLMRELIYQCFVILSR